MFSHLDIHIALAAAMLGLYIFIGPPILSFFILEVVFQVFIIFRYFDRKKYTPPTSGFYLIVNEVLITGYFLTLMGIRLYFQPV